MKHNRVCPYCGKNFVTGQNARKFCRKKCSILASKRKMESKNEHLCQWCGKLFLSKRSKKFCSPACHSTYMSKIGIYKKSVTKVPVKITLTDAVTGAKKEGMTYGRYVSFKKI